MSRCTSLSFSVVLITAISIGCGQSSDQQSAGTTDMDSAARSGLPTASIQAGVTEPAPIEAGRVVAGTPEWALEEIKRVRLQQLPETKDLEVLRDARRQRNLKIVELATSAIRQTHQQPQTKSLFTAAVHELLDARTQNAIQGSQDEVEVLYSDVAALERQYPDSSVSVEGALALVRLAHTKARRYAGEKPEWLTEFSRQARLFASQHPTETARSVPLLFTAGRSCELNGLLEDAIPCFEMLKEEFANTPQGQQSFGVLRRLNLVGQSVQLEGPTLSGRVVSIDDYRNRVTVVYFWSSKEPGFQPISDQIVDFDKKYRRAGLRFIGVNLDDGRDEAEEFLKQVDLPGEQIFFPKSGQQRWGNPIARYYGVLDIPQVWIVQPGAVVCDRAVELRPLEEKVRRLLLQQRGKSR